MKFGTIAACLLTAMLAAGVTRADQAPAAATQAQATSATPTFAGQWKLDEKHSENFRDKMAAARPDGGGGGWAGRGGGGGMRGGGGGGGWGRRGGGGGPDAAGGGPRDSSRAAEMRWLAEPPQMILVEQSDSSIVLSERGVTVQLLAFHAVAGEAPPLPPRFDARWDGPRLEAMRVNGRGRTTRETFELGPDGKTLVIVTHLEGGGDRPPIDLRRVYARYEGD